MQATRFPIITKGKDHLILHSGPTIPTSRSTHLLYTHPGYIHYRIKTIVALMRENHIGMEGQGGFDMV